MIVPSSVPDARTSRDRQRWLALWGSQGSRRDKLMQMTPQIQKGNSGKRVRRKRRASHWQVGEEGPKQPIMELNLTDNKESAS